MFALLLVAAAAAPAPVDDPDKVIRCVRESVTGSLSTTRRVCHTVGEWRKIRSDANDELRSNTQAGTLNGLNKDPGDKAQLCRGLPDC